MKSLLILGRQPKIGLAEVESLYGSDKLEVVDEKAVIVDVDPCLLAFDRLGGSVKFLKVLAEIPTTRLDEVEKFLSEVSPGQAATIEKSKLILGLNVIGYKITEKQIHYLAFRLKKAIKASGKSVRVIPNTDGLETTTAQVIHNKLTNSNGWDIYIIRNELKANTVIAQTIKVQDIYSYSARDQNRPKRDAKVGMLPPKLAQIIINLSCGKLSDEELTSICDIPEGQKIPQPKLEEIVLDPFCGSGVVLQEASLMGYKVIGSDLEPRMIAYSKDNLSWLEERFRLETRLENLETADATNAKFPEFNFLASEGYLGRPLNSLPSTSELDKIVQDTNTIIKKFLINLQPQMNINQRICLAVPAWQIGNDKFINLPLIDELSSLGYNRQRFNLVKDSELVYYRQNQVVARQLLVLSKDK